MAVTVVVGNPKPASRTLDAATLLATRLAGQPPETVIDVVTLGAGLLKPADPEVEEAVARVRASKSLVVASPTYKASFTGLLKLFLDRFPSGALKGVVTFPVMLGGSWQHALAPEVFLKPVLSELGAACPVRGLFLLESDYEDPPEMAEWLDAARVYTVPSATDG